MAKKTPEDKMTIPWAEFEDTLFMWEALKIGRIKNRVLKDREDFFVRHWADHKGLVWEYAFYKGFDGPVRWWTAMGQWHSEVIDPEFIYTVNLTTKIVYKREDIRHEQK